MASSESVVDLVTRQSARQQRVGPCIVSFEHGKVDADNLPKFKTKLNCSFADSRQKNNKLVDVNLSLKLDEVTYSNNVQSVQAENKRSSSLVTYLAIRDKNTNKVKLVEANLVTIGADVKMPESKNALLCQNEERTKKEDRKLLVKQFGQAKGRRAYEQSERMQVSADQEEPKLESIAQNVTEDKLIIAELPNAPKLTPPCNRKAASVEAVYQLGGILSNEEMELLKENVNFVKSKFPTEDSIQQEMVKKRMSALYGDFLKQNMKANTENELVMKRCVLALYAEAIIKLLRSSSKEIQKGIKCLPPYIHAKVRTKILDLFTQNGCLTPETRDRAICYAVISCLHANNFNIAFSLVTASFCTRAEQLKKLMSLIGAYIEIDSLTDREAVVLRLPLKSYVVRQGDGRKRR